MAHEGAHPDIRHEAAELVFHLVALLLGKELLAVGKYHAMVLRINLTAESFIDEVEADDAIIASTDGATTSYDCQIAVDEQAAQTERWQLYHTNGVRLVVDVKGDNVAHLFYIRYAIVGEDDALRGSCIEKETVLLAFNLNGQQDAVFVELNVDGINKIVES